MEEFPLMVSINCCVYNNAKYLKQTLDGFVSQKTTFKFEAIVHDDASTDGSTEIIKEYAEKYPEIIKPIIQIENQYSKGYDVVDKIMQKACIGKYTAFCEGDDYWTDPYKLQKQVDYMEKHPDCGLCYTDCDIYYQEDNRYERSIFSSGLHEHMNVKNPLLPRKGWYTANMTWMWRTDIFKEMPLKKDYIDSAFYIFSFFCLNSIVDYLPFNSGVYRRNSGSASCFDDEKRAFKYTINTFSLFEYLIPKFPNPVETRQQFYDDRIFSVYAKAIKYHESEIINAYKKFYPFWLIPILNREISIREKGYVGYSAFFKIAWKSLSLQKKIYSYFK